MKTILLALLTFVSIATLAQTTINFDDDLKWTAGSASLSSYAANHSYTDGIFSASGGEGLRENATSMQNGFPRQNGIYSWRLRNNSSVSWEANIASGGVNNFSLDIRRWDDSPSPEFVFEYSTNLGTSWTLIDTINNITLGNSSDFHTFTGVVNNSNSDIKFRIRSFGTTERIMIDDFMWTPFGTASVVDTIAIISSIDASVLENIGTVDINLSLNNPASSNKTVDLVLTSGNSAVVNGFTSQTVTFLPGSTMETVTLTIVPGIVASSETFDFVLNNPGSGVTTGTGNDSTYQLTVNEVPTGPVACSNLFFSEYIEGSSNNKALEIYNPTTNIIDLSNYSIRRYNNGNTSPSSTFYLSGSLIPGDVYVVANSQADPIVLALANATSGIASFNGDDAMELYDTINMTSIDIIGVIGSDPGSSWTVGTGATANNSLIRMSTVDAGAMAWIGSGDMQWDVLPSNDFSNIGMHTNSSCTAPIPLTAYPIANDTITCVGDSVLFSHTSFGGTAPYNVGWNINGTTYTQDSVWYVITTSGSITAQLGIVDADLATDNATLTFNANASPIAGFSLSSNTICAGAIATITTNTAGSNLTYSYGDFSSNGIFNTSATTGNGDYANTPGVYNLLQTVENSNGCSTEALETLTILTNSDASFTTLPDACELDTTLLNHLDTTGIWSGSGVTDLGSGQGFFTEFMGLHYITYTISGVCGDTFTDTVEVFASPVPNFTFSGSPSVSFTNTSTGGMSYSWDFGDGNTSAAQNPTNIYNANGTYTVILTVTSANGCAMDIVKSVTIQGLSIEENPVSFKMFPNPATSTVTINTIGNNSNIEIINLIGETVYSTKAVGNTTINLTEISKGAYFVRVTDGKHSSTQKLILK